MSGDLDQLFLRVITTSAPLVGKAYLEKLPQILVDASGGAAFLTRLERNGSYRMMGLAGVEGQDLPRTLSGEPWTGDSTTTVIYHPSNTGQRFPDDAILEGMETFFAVPLSNATGARNGYVGLLDRARWSANEAATAEALLRLVAPRAGAELERHQLQEQLTAELRNFSELAAYADEGFVSWIGEDHPQVVYANEAAARILGYEDNDVASDAGLVPRILAAAVEREGAANAWTGTLAVPHAGASDTMVALRLTSEDGFSEGRLYRCIMRIASPEDDTGSGDDPFSDVLMALPFAAIVVQDDDVIFMNPRASEVTGCTRENLLDRSAILEDSRSDVPLKLREFARRAQASASSMHTLRLKPPRGHERYIQMRTRTITLRGERALILAPLDLTREHAQQNKLQAFANLGARILESLPVDIIVVDGDGRVVAVSDPSNEFARRVGQIARCRPALAIGDDYLARCREEVNGDDEMGRQSLLGIGSVLNGTIPYFATQYESVDDAGATHSLVISGTPLKGGGAIIAHSDITPLKRNEARLAEEEARQRALLRNLPDQLARVSSDGRVMETWTPAAASRMVAPLPRAAMNRAIVELLPSAAGERIMKAVHDAIQSNAVVSCIIVLPYEDDEREYEMRAVPLMERESMLFVRDRTAEKWSPGAGAADAEAGQRQTIVRENAYGLTFREVGVLELMAQGASDKEIAATLGVSVFTVYKHVSKILHKMNAASRTEASLRVVREHMFS
ncbi:MAG TPA: PAS domain-containing protein [Dehalococcoidia bacterium]|nr:PAS domain-containing protein [Dehalococcoidia bacterium]